MPDPRPFSAFDAPPHGNYDNPPSTEASTPRTRRERLGRALRDTNGLAREHDGRRRAPGTLLSPLNRRRRRSPSDHSNDLTGTAGTSAPEADGRHREKRRRLAPFDLRGQRRPPIKYGHYGQVEPGRLQMELISCDGGEHIDPRHPAQFLGAKNILRHDKSVYCSERPSSNIVLRHLDNTPFCLEKLHIVGPEHGFTAPVREGVVYVAMTMNDLQKYMDPPSWARRATANSTRYLPEHRIQQPPPPARRVYLDSLRSSPERLTLSDALRDPEVSAAVENAAVESAAAENAALVNAVVESHERDEALHRQADAEGAGYHPNYYGEDFGFGRTDPEAHCDIPYLSTADNPNDHANAEGEYIPVTVLSDEDAGPEDTSTQEVLDFRLQRLRLMRRRYELNSWGRDDWTGAGLYLHDDNEPEGPDTLSRLDALMSRARMRDTPARLSPPPPPSSGDHHLRTTSDTPSSDPSAVGTEHTSVSDPAVDDPSVRAARFIIKKNKHKVAIKFDPPISGRFVMLKLWAHRGNVDVQSVIAKGFAGPRFFPAREMA